MANAKIGALHVSLGLDSAQFSAGLKNAQSALGKFGTIAARGFAALAAGATLAAGALGVAVKGAIDHADALSKSAQKAGVTVEALSRLEYAAKLSDISLEGLTGGLQKLGKSMADAVATPTSTAATAFKALGISLTDADGKLRNSDVVLADIADRFSRMEDGSTKTALAMQMFGKSGAELIPLLNSGRDGLKAMADESDRLGATISTKTAKSAELFNDTLTRIGTIMQGVVNRIMEAALPALQAFADTLASPEFAEAAVWLATTLVGAIDLVANAFLNAFNMAKQFGAEMMKWGAIAGNVATGNWGGALAAYQAGQVADIAQGFGSAFKGGWGSKPVNEITVRGGGTTPPTTPFEPTAFGNTGAADAERKKLEAEGKSVFDQTRTKLEAFNIEMANLSKLLDAGVISQDTYSRAVLEAQDSFTGLTSTLEGLGSTLAGVIKGTKDWTDVLLNVASSLISQMDFAGMGSTGGLLKGLLGGLVGFKDGGSGRIGGSGPPDSKLFMAKVSPGEAYAFGPDAERGGSRMVVTQHFSIAGTVSDKDVANMVQRGMGAAVETARRSLPGWQVDLQTNGG